MPVAVLSEPFANLMSCYMRAEGPFEHGTPIVELIQSEWDVFAEKLAEGERAELLLQAIMETDWDDDDGTFFPANIRAGVDGIRYPSAMAPDGTNVVLFRPSVVQIGSSRLVEVTDLRVEYRDV